MKVISFSIWGDSPIYLDGMYQNLALAKQIYPDWNVWIYFDRSVPYNTVKDFARHGARPISMVNSQCNWDGLFWRFLPASDSTVDVLIVRDADSRLTSREKVAVDEWIASDKGFHTMRDHWQHNVPIMGGMWGCKKGHLSRMKQYIDAWSVKLEKGNDQVFLQQVIWNNVRHTALAHDRYWQGMYRLPNGVIKLPGDVTYYNEWDNCGDDQFLNFPRGKIEFRGKLEFQRLDVYCYNPTKLFGHHEIRPFPAHAAIEAGRFVGESSQFFNKRYDEATGQYID